MFKESSHQANSIPTCLKTFNKTKINRVPNESCNDIPKQQQQYKKIHLRINTPRLTILNIFFFQNLYHMNT